MLNFTAKLVIPKYGTHPCTWILQGIRSEQSLVMTLDVQDVGVKFLRLRKWPLKLDGFINSVSVARSVIV